MNLIKTKKFIAGVFLIGLCNKHYGSASQVGDLNLSNLAETRSKVQSITGYNFRDNKILQDVVRHPSLYTQSKFRELEFLGDKVISAIIALRTFDSTKDVENLQLDFVEKTSNEYLAKISLGLGVFNLIRHNPSSRPESVAADAFEALVGAMQLDFKQHPYQISPAAIRFVLESFNMPVAQQPFLHESLEISPRGANRFSDARQLLLPENANQNIVMNLAGAAVAGAAVAGIGALWNWLSSGPDYKIMYEECRAKKNLYKSLCVVLGSILCWQYISPYLGFNNSSR